MWKRARLYTDALLSYEGLAGDYAHQVVDHVVEYVDGRTHTNGLENYWSLLKRGLSGTYVSVEPFHLFRYLDEQAFRYNQRQDMNDFDRFRLPPLRSSASDSHGMSSRASRRMRDRVLTEREGGRQGRGRKTAALPLG